MEGVPNEGLFDGAVLMLHGNWRPLYRLIRSDRLTIDWCRFANRTIGPPPGGLDEVSGKEYGVGPEQVEALVSASAVALELGVGVDIDI